MSDLAVRALLVGGVVLAAVTVVAILRKRNAMPHRVVRDTGLASGLYLLTSSACADCGPARAILRGRLGTGNFVEYSWEENREVLERLAVDAVPSTLLVSDDGSGSLWAGVPEEMFLAVDP